MLINLHSQATTTPKTRAEIQASDEPARVLAKRYGTTEQTVWKWRKRDSVNDRSHMTHRLQTTLTPAQEAVAVALRKTLPVSLDDLLAVVRGFLTPDVSRSGLDWCLRRHGMGLPHSHPNHTHGQWEGVHRPSPWPAQAQLSANICKSKKACTQFYRFCLVPRLGGFCR